jgi:hypothetical protein
MDVQSFVSEFLSSGHGQGAANALAGQGISPDMAQQVLSHAAAAGHSHAEEHHAGILGSHPGMSFFAAFAAGIVKGDGFIDAIGDGVEGVLVARVTEAITEKLGIDSATAATLAAAATPYVASFITSKLTG